MRSSSADLRWLADWCRQQAEEADTEAAEIERWNPAAANDARFERGRAAGMRRAAELITEGDAPSDLRYVVHCTRRRDGNGPFTSGYVAGLWRAAAVMEEQ